MPLSQQKKDMIQRYEPYQLVSLMTSRNYISASDEDIWGYMGGDIQGVKPRTALEAGFARLRSAFSSKSLKILNIDPLLVPLLEDTEPSFVDLHLPYNPMFINQKFEDNDGIIIGMMLFEEGDGQINIIGIDVSKQLDMFGSFAYDLTPNVNPLVPEKQLIQRAINIGTNLINLITTDKRELSFNTINVDERHNLKRIKKGKPPVRDTVFIRIHGRLQQYAKTYSQFRNSISVMFMVRGHWREFRALRYTEGVRGTKKWIYPFYKGMDLPEDMKPFVRVVESKKLQCSEPTENIGRGWHKQHIRHRIASFKAKRNRKIKRALRR